MCFIFITIVGCKPDSNPLDKITKDDLTGEWIIFYAKRNGNVTKSLEKGKFVFQADNLVSSNLFNTPNSLNFTYDKGTIAIEGDSNVTSLEIKNLYNDTLIVSSKMKVFDMEFHLKKK
jgi:hypothetical protein